MQHRKQDVSSLFVAVGLKVPVVIRTSKHTYEVDARHPQDNWLYPAFRGFEVLKKQLGAEGKVVKTFVAIGTGQGVDAVGAYHILRPQRMVVSDIHPAVLPIAQHNILNNTRRSLKLAAYAGNLCQPLREHGIVADVIYANLPNIPFDGTGSPYSGQLTSTFFSAEWISKPDVAIEKNLLSLQSAFLREAYRSLNTGGSVVLNLGGRVPISVVKKIFESAGFEYQELYATLKVQSQPEWVLGGYARAEKRYGTAFDFYRFDAAQKQLARQQAGKSISAEELKKILKPFHISATDSLKRFVYHHERIGHLVQVIRGIKLSEENFFRRDKEGVQ